MYKEFGIVDIKNDVVKRDLFWYAIAGKFNIDLGDFVWYDIRVKDLFLNADIPDKIKKYFKRDVKIQVGKLYGESKPYRTYKKPTPARTVNPAYPTFSWARTLLERTGA